MLEFLKQNYEFFQLVIFEGNYGGTYGVVVPHVYAEKIRELLTDGEQTGLDYEAVIRAENLFTDRHCPYPGAKAETIEEIIAIINEKFTRIDADQIFPYIDRFLKDFY